MTNINLIHKKPGLLLFTLSLYSILHQVNHLLTPYLLLPITFSPLFTHKMSRHNRRRTRGGHSAPVSYQHDAFELPSSAAPPDSRLPTARRPRRNDLSAKHWHNRYLAWQAKERTQKEEYQKIREERKRIFGGDSNDGEDDALCSNMMDYFTTLDYLEA